MKKLLIVLLSILFVSSNLITSCKKYEEGPAFSLLTKKARITGDWTLESYSVNGEDVTAELKALIGGTIELNIEKDGSYKKNIAGTTDTGKWKFGEDKDDVYFDSNDSKVAEDDYRILKLKSKELWLRQTQSNGDVEIFKFNQ